MRLGLLILSVSLLSNIPGAQANCSLQETTVAATKVASEASVGKPISPSPCFNQKKKVKTTKPIVGKSLPEGKMADGSNQTVSTVVSPIIIMTSYPQQQQPARAKRVTKVKTPQAKRETPKTEKVYVKQIVRVRGRAKKNTISAIGGMAPTKVSTSVDENEARVKTELGPVFGVQYQRHFDSDIVVGVGVLSNTTVTISVGLDF